MTEPGNRRWATARRLALALAIFVVVAIVLATVGDLLDSTN